MPYVCKLKDGKYELTKKDGGKVFGTHPSRKACIQQMRAIYSNEVSNPSNIVFNSIISMPWDLDTKIQNSDKEIHVVINSQGGDFFDAISIHNKLRASGKKVVCHVDPFAYSAAAVIALAGDEVYMVENGLLFFHTPKIEMYGIKDAEQLEKIADVLRHSEEVLINTLMSKTKKSHDECETMMKDTWLTPQEAMDLGIVDEIIPINRDVQVSNVFPERIINFVKEKSNMGMKELCQKFGISVEESENSSMEDKIGEFITNLQKSQPKPINVSQGVINMVKKARETELNVLVNDGKVVPAVVNELKLSFLADDRIKSDISTESNEFDKVVAALSKNETVVNFQPKTRVQIPDPNKDGNKDEANILVADMKSRKENK